MVVDVLNTAIHDLNLVVSQQHIVLGGAGALLRQNNSIGDRHFSNDVIILECHPKYFSVCGMCRLTR